LASCPDTTNSFLGGVETYICRLITVDFTVDFTSATSYLAGDDGQTYTLTIDPIKNIPQTSTLRVTFPAEVEMDSSSSTNLTCVITFDSGTTKTQTVIPTAYLPQVIGDFDTFFTGGTNADFKNFNKSMTLACGTFRNPRSKVVTSTFEVAITDPQG
jgi:hypothetical protein